MYLLVTGFYAFLSHLDYLYAAVAAYLCGCFNGALFTSRLFFHDDVRTHGSGNAGLTNFYRTYGARYALLVIACDMLKAVAAVSLAAWLGARFDPRMLPDLPLTAAEQAQAEAIRKTLGSTFCRRCGYCAPCPNGIDIPTNFLLANYLRRYGLADWARERYQALRYHAGSCVQCGACERRCPYGLPIRDMLGGVAKDFGY